MRGRKEVWKSQPAHPANPVGMNGTSDSGTAYVPGAKLPVMGSTRLSGLKAE